MPWRPCPRVADCGCASPKGTKPTGEDGPGYASFWPTTGPASQSTVAPTFSSPSTQLRGTLELGSGSGFRKESSANTTARSKCAPPLVPDAAGQFFRCSCQAAADVKPPSNVLVIPKPNAAQESAAPRHARSDVTSPRQASADTRRGS